MAAVQNMTQFFTQLLWIDYAIVVLLIFFLLIGLLRGVALETRALACWLLAGTVAWYFADDFTRVMNSPITNPKAQIAIAFGILFVLTLTVSSLIFLIYRFKKKRTYPSLWGHFAGMPVALLRGLIFVNILVLFAGLTPLPRDSWWQESKFLPYFQNSATWLKTRFPTGFAGFLHYS